MVRGIFLLPLESSSATLVALLKLMELLPALKKGELATNSVFWLVKSAHHTESHWSKIEEHKLEIDQRKLGSGKC
jgi:hypothetical protein